jgi:rSAM/selenodomain-associated transferase 2
MSPPSNPPPEGGGDHAEHGGGGQRPLLSFRMGNRRANRGQVKVLADPLHHPPGGPPPPPGEDLLRGLSIVIPMLNAAENLPETLASITGADEIVVVDGGSTDGSAALAEAFGARVIASPRGRGEQLRRGAAAAQGPWLLFLHADTRLEPGWRAAAQAVMAQGPGRAAVFRFALDDPDWRARWLEAAVAARVAAFALPYGDQGLLIHRDLYDAVGGFAALPLMEDVDLVRRLGRRRLVALPVRAVTSSRRWRAEGWLRRSARNLVCLTMFKLGVPIERIARVYGR